MEAEQTLNDGDRNLKWGKISPERMQRRELVDWKGLLRWGKRRTSKTLLGRETLCEEASKSPGLSKGRN